MKNKSGFAQNTILILVGAAIVLSIISHVVIVSNLSNNNGVDIRSATTVAQSQLNVEPLPAVGLEKVDDPKLQTAIKERDNYIKGLKAQITEYQSANQKWVEAEKKWQQDKALLSQEISNSNAASQSLAKNVQNFINELTGAMVDLSYHNSLYNDLLGMIPSTPTYYSQNLIDLNKDIAKIATYTWAELTCSYLENLVKSGQLAGVGINCSNIKTTSNSLKVR